MNLGFFRPKNGGKLFLQGSYKTATVQLRFWLTVEILVDCLVVLIATNDPNECLVIYSYVLG